MKIRLAMLLLLSAAFSWLASKDSAMAEEPQLPTLRVELTTPAAAPTPTPEPDPSPSPTPEPRLEPTPAPTEKPVTVLSTTIRSASVMHNYTSQSIDTAALAAQEPSLRLPAEGPQILIIHTHGSEAYTPTEVDSYEACGSWRTTDSEHNVLRVGEALKTALEGYGLSVLHDTELYDYPSYDDAYSRSAAAIEAYLAEYPNIAVIIDLHRDALGTEDTVYKTVTEESDSPSAQLMLVMGSDESLEHPNWQENLKLALALQQAADTQYPSLMRPIDLSCWRYNQQYTTGSMILEVGTCGNTMQEALEAAERFASVAGPYFAERVDKTE